jgi:hypothetical protein
LNQDLLAPAGILVRPEAVVNNGEARGSTHASSFPSDSGFLVRFEKCFKAKPSSRGISEYFVWDQEDKSFNAKC